MPFLNIGQITETMLHQRYPNNWETGWNKIEVAGTVGQSSPSTSSSPSKDSSHTIQFVEVKHLSSCCKAGK
jgi:hypothetical protein